MATKLKLRWLSWVILILAILALFWPVLLHPTQILFPTFSPFTDVMVAQWPKVQLIRQHWQAGQGLPYWNPLFMSGMPLAANQLAMLFYPPAWLFLLLPPEPVFNLLFIFHLLLGGLGLYFLLRIGHDLSPGSALLGALTFALNGKWLAHIAGGHVSMVGAIGWMPWAVLGVMMVLKLSGSRGEEKRSLLSGIGWVVIAAVALAMQIATHTLLLIYTGYLLLALVLWHFVVNGAWRIKRLSFAFLLFHLFAIPILAGLLGAAQLLPLAELARFSNRSLSLSQAAAYAVTPVQLWVGLLMPSIQGGHELVIYLGLVPLLLAPFGLSRRNRWSWFYAGLLIVAMLLALGPASPVHSLFYSFAPGFRWLRTPARSVFVGGLAIAMLVGFGLERLNRGQWSPAAQTWLNRLTIAVGALALLTGLGLAFGFGQLNRASLGLAIFIPAGLILIMLRGRDQISARSATILLGLLLFLDLASFGRSMIRFISPQEALAPGRPVAEYLARQPGRFRVYSPSYSLPVQTAASLGLNLADGVEGVHLASYDRFMARAGGYGDASFSATIPNFANEPPESALRETEPDLKLLGLLNVEYLASAFPMDWPGLSLETKLADTYIYHNGYALPRAWVAPQAIPIEGDWLVQVASLPADGSIVLVADSALADRPTGDSALRSTATVGHYSADLMTIETEIDQPGWLVVSEIWYPGWQATVNGAARPVERVNGLLRGVYLSQPGDYQVSLSYRPPSIIWGTWISGLTVAGLLLLGGGRQVARAARRSRTGPMAPPAA